MQDSGFFEYRSTSRGTFEMFSVKENRVMMVNCLKMNLEAPLFEIIQI